MAKIATKLEDIGDERDQAVFMATVKLWFNGDLQAALDRYNAAQEKYDALDAEIEKREQKAEKKAEVHFRFPHQ